MPRKGNGIVGSLMRGGLFGRNLSGTADVSSHPSQVRLEMGVFIYKREEFVNGDGVGR